MSIIKCKEWGIYFANLTVAMSFQQTPTEREGGRGPCIGVYERKEQLKCAGNIYSYI